MYYCIWFCADFLCLAVFLFFKIKEGNWKNPSYLGKEVCNITTEVQFLKYFNSGMVFTILHKGIFFFTILQQIYDFTISQQMFDIYNLLQQRYA